MSLSYNTAKLSLNDGQDQRGSSYNIYQFDASTKHKEDKKEPTRNQEPPEVESCPVCFDDISEKNSNKLPACEHRLCHTCYPEVIRTSPLCPVCRKPFAELRGNQPHNATMKYSVDKRLHLPGYEKYGTIIISYFVPNGTQTTEHPKPGMPFYGTTRHAYLPDNGQGNRALQLLRKAFDARLVFTVGRSITTGMDDVVTWNDIHHKTSVHGGPTGYGYPDETYLTRLIEDLAAKGIV